ncbi:MAG: hypothetical protein WD941_08860 [Opitutus sp.]
MSKSDRKGVWNWIFALGAAVGMASVASAFERFNPPDSKALEVWRLTNDPTVRDWINYHNVQDLCRWRLRLGTPVAPAAFRTPLNEMLPMGNGWNLNKGEASVH